MKFAHYGGPGKADREGNEQRSKRARARYSFLDSPAVNFLVRTTGIIENISRISAEQLGYEEYDLIDRNIREFVTPYDRDKAFRELWRDFGGRYAPGIELDLMARDGSIHTILFSIGPAEFDRENQPRCVLFSGIDITDRREAEEELKRKYVELRRVKEKLENANTDLLRTQAQLVHSEKMASIGTLAEGMAHEINNPLQIIMGMSEIISTADELDSVREDSTELLVAAQRIREIVKSLTNYSRDISIDAVGPVDLNEVMRKSIEMSKYSFRSREIDIETELNELPKIRANTGELVQVFIHLLSNAMDATEEDGKISVRTETVKGSALIKITDTGCGISPENVPKIFDPFFTTKEVGKGSGLGLYMVHQIVTKYNGTVSAESKVDEGTIITLKLPISTQKRGMGQPIK